MKRTLSIILAIMMILSTVSFAAPSMAGVVDTAKETSDTDVEQVASNETAGLTAEKVGDPVILKEWNFSNDLEGVVSRNSTDKNSTYEEVLLWMGKKSSFMRWNLLLLDIV